MTVDFGKRTTCNEDTETQAKETFVEGSVVKI